MAAKTNVTTSAQFTTSAREVDFVSRFADNWDALRNIMGIMRPIRKAPGTKLVSYKASVDGGLKGGTVAEGDEIPFTKMKVDPVAYGDIDINKYAKSVTIESVAKYGADVAVEKTDEAFLVALQNKVLTDFYTFLGTGTLKVTEKTWQRALAMAKGKVLDKFAGLDILPEGKDGLTIEALPDGDLTDDLVKSGLTIYSKSGMATYGRITRHIKWDDVTVAANLQTKAKAALADNGLSMPETITCKAVDLGWQDGIQHFRVGRMTALFSTPHGYSASYPLMELAPDILDPGNTQITLGATQQTYTGAQIDAKRETDKRIESTRQEISERVDESSSQVIQATHQQITDLQQNVNSIILSALENYVETGDFDSYKEEVSTKLSVLTDQLSIDITKVTERIDKVDGDLQSKYSEITKAFRFTSDGLIIGETGNEILLRLDNDVLQFVRNNTPELQITAEGVEAMRIKVSILCIGNVVWTEDENGDVIAS